MTLICCIDDRNGMSFHQKRQSRDRILIENLLLLTQGKRLWMSPDSAKLFPSQDGICADENYATLCQEGDCCFVETGEFPSLAPKRMILYRWNRLYPSDQSFPARTLLQGFTLVSTRDFEGSSHPRITEEIYLKLGDEA
jgi:hypothetical protein